MEELDETLLAGSLLCVSQGEYSDYRYDGPVRVVKDFTKREAADAYRAAWVPSWDGETGPQPGNLLAWLVKAGYVEAVENSTEWHVGCYGRFEP